MKRRDFLFNAALGSSLLLGASDWARAAPSEASASRTSGRLVVVFLRGAIDGLSVVVPYADPEYYRLRSSIAIPPPGQDGGGLDLDGHFALHPALSSLLPLWQSGQMAFVHASGSPDPTRSHFDAQDYMESGTPGRKTTPDGWLNRLMGLSPGSGTALSVGELLPRALSGAQPVAMIGSGKAALRSGPLDRPMVGAAFDRLYGSNDKLGEAYREARQSSQQMRSALEKDGMDAEMRAAANGAASPGVFVDDARRLARLMRGDPRLGLAFLAVGGWDTHANQGGSRGQLARRLQALGEGLAALAQGLGPAMGDTVVIVMSEFGRTARENGNGGTDHGHGNVMWLLGGPVAGGGVYGHWPGLDTRALHEGRDLAVTTDFRDVLATVAERHMRMPDTRLSTLFPDFAPAGSLPLLRS